MPPPKRIVYCQDSLPWLAAHRNLDAIVTSIPDQKEVGLSFEKYIAFFRTVVNLCLSAVKSRGYCIFLQTDRKKDGWIDKSYIINDEAAKLGMRLLWHKIALRTDVGKIDLFRPTYSHMLCFSEKGRVGKASPNVIYRGPVTYDNAFGADAVEFVINYLKTQGMREIVDPFVGSGTTLAIANKYGMDAVGIDLDPKQCKRALKLDIQ